MRPSIDLSAALAASERHEAQQLTLSELVRAWSTVALDGSDLRLRKWLLALGHRSAWDIQSSDLITCAQAMVQQGYKPASANRDLSALGTAYRWAISRRLSPRGFRSPTLDAPRMEEGTGTSWPAHRWR